MGLRTHERASQSNKMNTKDFDRVAKFTARELAELKKQSKVPLILPKGNSTTEFTIDDWQLIIGVDQVVCKKYKQDPLTFYSKTCAIVYILSELSNNWPMAISITTLDKDVYRLTTDSMVLRHKMKKSLKSCNFERFTLLNNKHSEVSARLTQATGNIQKYCYLTKYNKGMML